MPARPAGGGGPQTILVADAEVLVRMAIAAYLRDCGYRVIEAAGAVEAMTLLDQGDVQVDAVLADLDLRGPADGFSLAHWIRARRPGLRIVLAATPARAADAAADLCDQGPFLRRPYEPQAVADAIRRMLAAADRSEPQGGG